MAMEYVRIKDNYTIQASTGFGNKENHARVRSGVLKDALAYMEEKY